MHFEDIMKAVENGSVSVRKKGDFSVFCYTKDTFFDGDWNDVTKACRGLVTHNGEIVNHPFPKIFNLDEVPETSLERVMCLLNTGEPYHTYHKANGHLCIVDYISDLDQFLVHTKGSLQSEMTEEDEKIWNSDRYYHLRHVIRLLGRNATLMFESIVDSDKHTMYEHDVVRYGENTLVLLGGYMKMEGIGWTPITDHLLLLWNDQFGIPVVDQFSTDINDKETIKFMFDDQDTEGYVIWFPNIDLRVKIKTKEYWKLRFRKDLNVENTIAKFRAGGFDRLWHRYPEEVADIFCDHIKDSFKGWIESRAGDVRNIIEEYSIEKHQREKIIHHIPNELRSLAYHIMNGNSITDEYVHYVSCSRIVRDSFCRFALNDPTFTKSHENCLQKLFD